MRLVDINVYPVKSGRGISLPEARVEARGLAADRRWMVVDANARFLTQRELPALARLHARPKDVAGTPGLRLSFGGESIDVPCPATDAFRQPVTVWRDMLLLPEAISAAGWLSQAFGQDLRLFYQPDDVHRPIEDWAREGDEVSLSDGFPLLVVNMASLEAVHRAAGAAFGTERFRPSLVIEGAPAWSEDGWASIRIGTIVADLVKPCARCKITTVDQARGEVADDEPLATLRRIRMSGDRRVPGVLFGWNAVPRSFGSIRVGDRVEILATRPPWPLLPDRASAQVEP